MPGTTGQSQGGVIVLDAFGAYVGAVSA
jgi:hypothetical protein